MKNKLIILAMFSLLTLPGCASLQDKTPVEVYFESITDIYDLPNDPGEDGLVTIKGIDSNDNGVRDDVEREIYLLIDVARQHDYYPDLASFEMDLARKFEAVLTNKDPVSGNRDVLNSIRALQKYVYSANTMLRTEERVVPQISLIHEKEVMYIANIIRGLVYNTQERQSQLESQMIKVKALISEK